MIRTDAENPSSIFRSKVHHNHASHFVQESYRKIFGERITAVIPDLGTTSTYQLQPPTAQNAFKVYSLHIKYNTSSMIPIMVSIYLFFLSLVLYYIGECTKDGRKMQDESALLSLKLIPSLKLMAKPTRHSQFPISQ